MIGIHNPLLRLSLVILLLPLLVSCADSEPSADPKPSFIFILVDDMGWSDAVCYGSSFYETPNIDRLAASGIRFTDAYAACPVCSPTRASIMTGKYPARLDITDWIPGRQARGAKPDEKMLSQRFRQELPLGEITIAESLRDAGYETFFAGKWHLGGEGFYPEDQGFNTNIGGWEKGSPQGGYFSPYDNPKLVDGPAGEHLADRLTGEALRFLQNTGDKPFFLYLSYYSVHIPLQAKQDLIRRYEEKAGQLPPYAGPRFLPEGKNEARQVQDHPVYAGMIHTLDENIGRLLDGLERLGLANKTILLFTSDNGGLSTSEGSPTANLPLRAGKGWLYEGGIREPTIIRWPGVVTPGSISNEPMTSTDFYPTILEMANLPFQPEQHYDGVSIAPLLKGEKESLDRDALFWHYPHYSNQGGTPGGAIRMGDFKLIEFYEDDHVELYNLREDIGETEDLAESNSELTNRLRERLTTWRQSVGAKMPTENPRYDPLASR